jgi:hypothetical protein
MILSNFFRDCNFKGVVRWVWVLGFVGKVSIIINAQNFYTKSLVSVSFSGTGSDYIPVVYDNNTGSFDAPHFITAPYTQKPVAYLSGSFPRVSAKLNFLCLFSKKHPSKIWIRGTHYKLDYSPNDKNFIFKEQEIPFSNGVDLIYPITAADNKFEEKTVDFYDYDFNIIWEYRFSSTGNWIYAGESKNLIYITFKSDPSSLNFQNHPFSYFQTVLHHGCKFAEGETTEEKIYEKLRSYYSTHHVLRADGLPLKYYGSWDLNQNQTTNSTAGLLFSTDGTCVSWSKLFIDVLKAQGMWSVKNYVPIKSVGMPDGFYVKTWDKVNPNSSGSSGNIEFPYLNIWGSLNKPHENNNYKWFSCSNPKSPEVIEIIQLEGQNNTKPLSRFEFHRLVLMYGIYFDPSYGITYSNTTPFSEQMDAAISSFYKVYSVSQGSGKADKVMMNPSGIDIDCDNLGTW